MSNGECPYHEQVQKDLDRHDEILMKIVTALAKLKTIVTFSLPPTFLGIVLLLLKAFEVI